MTNNNEKPEELSLVPDWQGMYFREKELREDKQRELRETIKRYDRALEILANQYEQHIFQTDGSLSMFLIRQAEREADII